MAGSFEIRYAGQRIGDLRFDGNKDEWRASLDCHGRIEHGDIRHDKAIGKSLDAAFAENAGRFSVLVELHHALQAGVEFED
jgi:hypothetical protein